MKINSEARFSTFEAVAMIVGKQSIDNRMPCSVLYLVGIYRKSINILKKVHISILLLGNAMIRF